MEKHVGHIISLTFDIHWTKLLASSNFLLRSSSYGIRPKKAGEELWSKEHTPNCPKHREPTDVHLAWEATCEGINRKSSHDMPRLQMCSCQCTQNGHCFVRSGRKPNPKVNVEWPLLVVFVPVAPGDAAWRRNQHGPASPCKQSQMQWTSMDPRACNQRTQHPNTMTRSRSQDASSFFLASWQPENTVNIRAPFTGSTEAVTKSRVLLPMSRWLGGSLSSEEYMYTWKNM